MASPSPSNFLSRAYPYFFSPERLPWTMLIASALFFLFNYLLEPFGIDHSEQKISYAFTSLIHSIFPALIIWVYFGFLNRKMGNDANWTVGKEIRNAFIVLLLIGIINWLTRDWVYDNPNNWSANYLLEEVLHAILVGGMFVAILIPLNFSRMYRQQLTDIQAISPSPQADYKLPIKTQVQADDFKLEVEKLLLAKTEGNYVEFFLAKEGGYEKLTKRISLKELEEQLQEIPWLFRTHRTYLVNLKQVANMSGNAQGYQLQVPPFPETVPVSRGMVASFKETMKAVKSSATPTKPFTLSTFSTRQLPYYWAFS